ncbi:MAG: methenyltetrahydromethanopterin cyclohydrolase [Negativicutes bacterium]|nr:methenyltetrahydromethanopterin cyclohydrolase [Negativicutes bacterium]
MPVPRLAETQELSPNLCALPLVEQLVSQPERFGVAVSVQEGVTVIDCGVRAPGGWEAGRLFAAICLGGLAQVELRWGDFGGWRWPAVEVITDHPVRACLASQYAGWLVKQGKFSAMGSGPGRAVVCAEELFTQLAYKDHSPVAVFCLESSKLPPPEAVRDIAERCGRESSRIFILTAPTASPVGSVQIAARAVETGLHKLKELGCDLGMVQSGWGICPVPPVAANDLDAIGRTNDAVLYGSTVHYNVCGEDELMASLVDKIPALASSDYGQPFGELYRRYGNFYAIDPFLFSPAEVWLSNLQTGRSFHAGEIRSDILKASFALPDRPPKGGSNE